MSDVFISHSSKDSEVAEKVCDYLEERGLDCWMAPRNIVPGSNWAASISNAVTDTKVFLIIYSENSASSEQVEREISLAEASKGVTVVPYKIDNAKLTGAFMYYLTSAHWVTANVKKEQYKLDKLYAHIYGIINGREQTVIKANTVTVAPFSEQPSAQGQSQVYTDDNYSVPEQTGYPQQYYSYGDGQLPASEGYYSQYYDVSSMQQVRRKKGIIITATIASVILLAVTIVLIAVSAASCNSRSKGGHPLVGTWELQWDTSALSGDALTQWNQQIAGTSSELILYEDGTAVLSSYTNNTLTNAVSGTWIESGSVVILSVGENSAQFTYQNGRLETPRSAENSGLAVGYFVKR